jgi:MFS family permease
MVAELFGLNSHGTILGAVMFGGTIGGAAGPLLAGHLFDITGSYQIHFLTCALFSFIGIILTLFLIPTKTEIGYPLGP